MPRAHAALAGVCALAALARPGLGVKHASVELDDLLPRGLVAFTAGLHRGEGLEVRVGRSANVSLIVLFANSEQAGQATWLLDRRDRDVTGVCHAAAEARFELSHLRAHVRTAPLRERGGALELGAASRHDGGGGELPWVLSMRAAKRDEYALLVLRCPPLGDTNARRVTVDVAVRPLCREWGAPRAAREAAPRRAAAGVAEGAGGGGVGSWRIRMVEADASRMTLNAVLLSLVLAMALPWLYEIAISPRHLLAVHAILLLAVAIKAAGRACAMLALTEHLTPELDADGYAAAAPGGAHALTTVAAVQVAARHAERLSVLGEVLGLTSSGLILTALLLISAGYALVRVEVSAREREAISLAFALYLVFGVLDVLCDQGLMCGVYVLAFQVIRFLSVFAVIVALNSTVERIRSESAWNGRVGALDFSKLLFYRTLRWVTVLVYLVLPILLLFLEATLLPWHAAWMKLLWREALDLSVTAFLMHHLQPSNFAHRHFFLVSGRFFEWWAGARRAGRAPRRPWAAERGGADGAGEGADAGVAPNADGPGARPVEGDDENNAIMALGQPRGGEAAILHLPSPGSQPPPIVGPLTRVAAGVSYVGAAFSRRRDVDDGTGATGGAAGWWRREGGLARPRQDRGAGAGQPPAGGDDQDAEPVQDGAPNAPNGTDPALGGDDDDDDDDDDETDAGSDRSEGGGHGGRRATGAEGEAAAADDGRDGAAAAAAGGTAAGGARAAGAGAAGGARPRARPTGGAES